MAEPRPRVWLARPLFEDITGRLDEHFEVVRSGVDDRYAAEEIAARLRDVDGALVTLVERVGAGEIATATRLRAVANVGVGHDNIDIDAASAAGVLVTNTPDVLTATTADFGFALLMAAARRVTEAEHWLRAGRWDRWSFDTLLGADLHGSTLGIVGLGRIGQAIARRAAGFEMRVLYHSRNRVAGQIERGCRAEYVELAQLLQHSDHVVLALPHSPQTHHLIDAAALARMKPTATLVNIARGGVVDETALAAALAAGRLGAAGLDVYEDEPRVRPELLALENVVLTPHIASASLATRRAMVSLAVDNLIAALGQGPAAGQPPTPVNAGALKR